MRRLFLTLILVYTFVLNTNAQTSVQFTSPNDNQVFNIQADQNTAYVQVNFIWPPSSSPRFKLTAPPLGHWESRDYYGIEHDFYLTGGTYTWTIEVWTYVPGLGDVSMGTDQVTFYVRPALTAKNSFAGGTIKVNGVIRNAPYTYHPSSNTLLEAIDQYKSPYMKRFKKWSGESNSSNRSISAPAPTSANVTYTADFNDEYNVSFQNNFSGGVIKVNGVQYSSPTTSFPVVQGNTITGTAINLQVDNGIQYSFTHWSDGSTLSSKTFTPSNHTTYTAYFTGRPENSYRNLHDIGAVGQPIVLDWEEHPNTAVTQYKIYRKVKINGVSGPEQLIGTKSRGTTTFTDYRYTKSRTYDEYLLFYDVRAYYSTEGTYSNPDYIAIYGGAPLPKISDTTFVTQDIPKDYSLSNYPNPFNPTTVIEYQLPKAGYVEIKVYDAIGKEVATLVNEEKEIGRYQARFGSNDLPSGMYIYTIKVNDYFASKKMLLIK